ncbi:uncharacterized protein LOC122517540 [Polistes fuscatus]|uniref:uncharacterized protein LOC122517540 n=1 Tax=Polistes fuscatus TaxID=30207 RepID=UPI001CA82A0D|nr:uncharacterized protein LOC122517540 [Polistes fuscatus]
MTRGTSEILAEGTTVNMVHRKQQRSLHQQQQQQQQSSQQNVRKSVSVMGSRRIFAPAFKLKVLDSYRHDIDCRGNQRATARKYGIHRRQIQKWLQCEDNLRNSCAETNHSNSIVSTPSPSLSSPSSSSSPSSTTTVISKQHDVTLSTSEGAAMPGVTPAVPAPALNLGLARLHGDESTVRPPLPLLPSRPLTRDSPSSPRYTHSTSEIVPSATTTTTTTMTMVDGYSGPRDQHQRSGCHAEIENEPMHQVSALNERERTFYDWNSSIEEQRKRHFESNSPYDIINEYKIYESFKNSSYQSNIQDFSFQLMDTAASTITTSPTTTPGSADSSSMDGIAYCRTITPSMVKTERSSPVTATAWTEHPPISPKKATRVAGVNDCYAGSNTSSVVLYSESLYSNKCSESIGKKNCMTLLELENMEEERRRLFCDVRIKKEEIDEEEEEESRLPGEEETREGGGVPSFYIETHPAGRTSFPADSRSPDDDQEGTYSEPGSISARSSSGSCSDSEMESLIEYCQSNETRTSSNDLGRRRSFSLRFKLKVLDAFHQDIGVAGNQRATARKFGINRRQVQKWLGQESELRGEIALRGNARQRLGPSQEQTIISLDFPVDLRTTNYTVSPIAEEECVDVEYVERSTPFHVVPSQQMYCCEWASPSSLSLPNNRPTNLSPEIVLESSRICTGYTCCMEGSNSSCYQELRSSRGSSYTDSVTGLSSHCYLSPREYNESAATEESPAKRRRCTATLSCCYDEFVSNSPKRSNRMDADETPPQEAPLCLVKQKRCLDFSPSLVEPVTSTAPTPPISQQAPPQPQPPPTPAPPTTITTTNSKDAILFKPYLDNPISKPSKETGVNRDPSPFGTHNLLNHENNNCQSICNLNEDRVGHGYAIELNLKVPLSWRNQTSSTLHPDFHPIRSAFVRYPASSPHFI